MIYVTTIGRLQPRHSNQVASITFPTCDTMQRMNVVLQVPAREGNTCYRPPADSVQLRTILQESLSDVDPDVELGFEEVLLTGTDEPDETRLLINNKSLAQWASELDETSRHQFESTIKPALTSERFGRLENGKFLRTVLEFILEQD